MLWNKRFRYHVLVIVTIIAAFVFWKPSSFQEVARILRPLNDEHKAPQLRCRSLPGANETLFVLRTGSTELEDRLPIHFSTSLRCFQYYMIFSDYEEIFRGEHILNALESVDPHILTENKDFELYRRLQHNGRAALAPSELSGSDIQAVSSSGNAENPGWKLDKWKFLPMVNRTFHEYPNMKWYVFVEADTFIFWSMLQPYLALTDHTQPYYAGDQMTAGTDNFAHGGAGFVVSQPALRMVTDHYAAHKAEIESLTNGHWAGDIVLGRVFSDIGVPFTDMWPLMNGDSPGARLYANADDVSVPHENWQVWCQPTVSYHHMSPAAVEDLWRFEQQWLQTRTTNSDYLRHKDIFKHYVMPQMMTLRVDWDNMSDEEEGNVGSIEECRAMCEAKLDCKQYSYAQIGLCKTRVNPRLGIAGEGVSSGWIMDRVLRFEQDMAPCGSEEWSSD